MFGRSSLAIATAEGGGLDGFAADGVIRNFRSDGPADRTPYGMGGHYFVTRGRRPRLERGGGASNHSTVGSEGDRNNPF